MLKDMLDTGIHWYKHRPDDPDIGLMIAAIEAGTFPLWKRYIQDLFEFDKRQPVGLPPAFTKEILIHGYDFLFRENLEDRKRVLAMALMFGEDPVWQQKNGPRMNGNAKQNTKVPTLEKMFCECLNIHEDYAFMGLDGNTIDQLSYPVLKRLEKEQARLFPFIEQFGPENPEIKKPSFPDIQATDLFETPGWNWFVNPRPYPDRTLFRSRAELWPRGPRCILEQHGIYKKMNLLGVQEPWVAFKARTWPYTYTAAIRLEVPCVVKVNIGKGKDSCYAKPLDLTVIENCITKVFAGVPKNQICVCLSTADDDGSKDRATGVSLTLDQLRQDRLRKLRGAPVSTSDEVALMHVYICVHPQGPIQL